MGETRDAWQDVAERFAAIGRQFKTGAAPGAGAGAGASDVGDALRDVVAAIDRAFSGLEDAVSDPDLRDDAKAALVSLRDAVSTTFEDLGAGLRREPRGEGGSSADGPDLGKM